MEVKKYKIKTLCAIKNPGISGGDFKIESGYKTIFTPVIQK